MAVVVTNTGKARFTARDAGGPNVIIDNIRIGSVTRYDAVATATAIRDTNPVILSMDDIDINASEGDSVTIAIEIIDNRAITATEVGFYSGNDLIILSASADRNQFVKAANTTSLYSLVYTYLGDGEPVDLSVTVTINVPMKATDALIDAKTDDTAYMTVRGVIKAIADNTEPLSGLTPQELWAAVYPAIDDNFHEGEGIDITYSGTGVTFEAEDASVTNKGIVELETTTQTRDASQTDQAATGPGVKALVDHRIQIGITDITQNIFDGMPDGGVYIKRSTTAITL